ncbi:MAG TPA: TatD family hydrolase [Burkholderiaceae bacterium]|jgi:TatD DNase family protein|nr:TatD family hydrolase [Burkholderiaceae bacterium]
MYIDSHCHLSFPELAADHPGVLDRMRRAGVSAAMNVCVRMEEFADVLALAETQPDIFATVGAHPDTTQSQEPTVEQLVARAAHPRVLAIGETGLDYYRLEEPLDWQRDRFRVHIRAARQAGKPLVVHTRSAPEDTLKILKEERASEAGGVMHCFTESLEFAREALELGFYISFSGIVTFRNAGALQAIVPHIPLDRLLIETDAPYLSPVPYRGKINEPARVVAVAQKLAELTSQPVSAIARATHDNFLKLFRPPSPESSTPPMFPAVEGTRIM